ncbi:hypothetical protein PK28_03170 [Hymenobacter sp. DG25B]|uniref:hypothetical protein n=1 Tax=Hymenobacter sp. DG25B TaxID=1385664 RepID=UPI000541319B|nr:hypothetical protein [Hymenobacter sp. DG25B]AIZ62934.1 hypothetical protein PK28_03170 [Hymenobacter sp. DG25B]
MPYADSIKTCLFLFLLAFGVSLAARGQVPHPDSTFLTAAARQLTHHYEAMRQDQSQLYHGKEYVDYTRYYRKSEGHQFFESNKPQLGSVAYWGHSYPNVPLLYDIRLDQLVLQQPATALFLHLVEEKVAGFTVGTHRFVRLENQPGAPHAVATGFYEVLLDGPVRVLAKRRKEMKEQSDQKIYYPVFRVIDQLYVQMGNAYYPVSQLAPVLRIFPDQRKELQKFSRSQKLRFKKATREADLVRLIRYYQSLPAATP